MAKPQDAHSPPRKEEHYLGHVPHVSATFNNTMITITDVQGNTISWSSAGMAWASRGRASRRPMQLRWPAEDAGRKRAMEHGVKTLEVACEAAPGSGRESALAGPPGRWFRYHGYS